MRIAVVLFLLSVQAQASGLPREIAVKLRMTGIPAAHFGIYVRDVSKSKPMMSWHAEQPMSPASTMKLVTTYAALSILGPAYTWKTEAYASEMADTGILDGPLFLKGYGDPDFGIERLWLFVKDLRARGLNEIRGGLVFDKSRFAVSGDPGSFDGKPYRPYNVIPDALLVNFESNSVKFVPEGNSVRLILLPDFPSLAVENRLKIAEGPCNDWEEGISERISGSGKSAKLEIEGSFPRECGEKEDEVALYSHPEYLYQLFSMLWQETGGKIEGDWREGKVPPGAKLLASAESPPLSSVIVGMNKYSNNVMARQIFLSMGAQKSVPATEESAREEVSSWLKEAGLVFPELAMENGSGLSRTARISPMHLGELLVTAYRSPLMPEFFASLPIAGIDGTMKKRLKDTAATGRAWIKTGSLEGVRAIAGVVQAKSGKRLAVVCLVNDKEARAAKPFEDFLLEWLAGR